MKDKKAIISISAITFILMITGSVFPSLKIGINRWSMCNWAITYETGFIYRGLVGTIFKFIFGMVTEKKIYFISLLLVVILYFLIAYTFINIYKKDKGIYSFLLILFIACQPSNIRWWATDEMYARLDILIVFITLSCCIIFLKIKNKNLQYILPVILSTIALLIHEGFGVLFASMLFALMLFEANKGPGRIKLSPLYFYYIPIMSVFAFIVLTGGRDVPVEEINPIFAKNVSADFSNSMNVVVRQVITDNFKGKMSAVKSLQSDKVTLSMIFTYIELIPSMFIFFGLFTKMIKSEESKRNKALVVVIIGSCFAPICASFIAYDQFRWIGYFIICLSIALVYLCFSSEKYWSLAIDFIKSNKYYFMMVTVFYLSLGVLHDMRGIGYLETIVARIFS